MDEHKDINNNLQPEVSKHSKFWSIVKKYAGRYFITAFTGMTTGLFCTLIAGTIIQTIATIFEGWAAPVYTFLFQIGYFAKIMMGAGIGAGIAHSLKAPKLVIASAIAAGFMGAFAMQFNNFDTAIGFSFGAAGSPGNPINSYLCALVATELGLLVFGKTKFDILVVPITCLVAAGLIIISICPPVDWLITKLGEGINSATGTQPFIMSVIISVTMGILLTLPTSSAAIGISAGLSGLAAGAAVAGCCSHMIGFAVSSFRENRFSGLISQGLGTSMLQIPNIAKKPILLIPAVVASAICGPVAVLVFGLQSSPVGSGMGTAGLVGVIETIKVSLTANVPLGTLIVGVLVCLFILPAVISLLVSEFMRHKQWIKFNDLKLEQN